MITTSRIAASTADLSTEPNDYAIVAERSRHLLPGERWLEWHWHIWDVGQFQAMRGAGRIEEHHEHSVNRVKLCAKIAGRGKRR